MAIIGLDKFADFFKGYDFYNFMLEGRIRRGGVSILRAPYLIPFKMFAWLNLLEDKAQGKHVNEKDLRKHKNDVFHLLQIIPDDERNRRCCRHSGSFQHTDSILSYP